MGVYNSISNIQRIAFIDKLNDTDAKRLSLQYPFAICYASENENNNLKWLPGFWKNGQRYGIQTVDTTPITINDIELSLNFDNNYCLQLVYAHVVKAIELVNLNNVTLDGNNNPVYPYEIYTIGNTIGLGFKFYNDVNKTEELSNNLPTLRVSDINADNSESFNNRNFINIFNELGSSTYTITTIKNCEDTLALKFIANSDTALSINVNAYLFPDDINWHWENYTTIDNLSGAKQISYNFDTEKYHIDNNKFSFEFKVYRNGIAIDKASFITNENYNASSASGSIIISPSELTGTYTIKTYFTDQFGITQQSASNLIIEVISSIVNDEVYYIGMYDNSLSQNIVVSSDHTNPYAQYIENNIYEQGWHLISAQLNYNALFHKYEAEPFTLAYDTIIIPNGYSLYLPLFTDGVRLKDEGDESFLEQAVKTTINVNGEEYNMYKFNTVQEDGFVNSIIKM